MALKQKRWIHPKHHKPGYIYFISSDDLPDFPVKIGIAYGDVSKRLKGLQLACPFELKVLATVEGTFATERIIHIEHHKDRLRGEWFRRSPEVMAEISRASETNKKHAKENVRTEKALALLESLDRGETDKIFG